MREGTVTLADGRAIGYAEYGVADGIPVFEFHGLPGSRHYDLRADALAAAGVRWITLERPGFGLSDPKPGRTLLDWADDVGEVADRFGFERFSVLGYSAGGPYAAACGYARPERVGCAGLAAAVGPVFDNPALDQFLGTQVQALLPIAREDQAAALAIVRDVVKPGSDAWAADPDGYFDTWLEGWAEIDRPAFRAKREMWVNVLAATNQRGTDTTLDDVACMYGPWGFTPADIRVPVRAWHGLADDLSIEPIRFVCANAPDGQLTEYPGEGHVLDERHHDDWLATLTEWAR